MATHSTSPKTAHLSLASAILINVNIMLGSGLFINSVVLAKTAGVFSTIVYPVVGLFLIPLITIFSLLLAHYPGATFYELGFELHPTLGFLSSWGYFIGKLASSALSIHISVTTAQKLLPQIAFINSIFVDVVILFFFIILNLFNVKTERPIQYLFVTLKSIPVLIVISSGIALFSPVNFIAAGNNVLSLLSTIPFVIFAFAGFEASCSLSKNIINPARNGPRAIVISFAIVLLAVSLFQLGLYGALGETLGTLSGFQEPFRLLIQNACSSAPFLSKTLMTAAFLGISCSALGASYSILYSNVWNLHTLAGYGVVPYAKKLSQCNRFLAPSLCIAIAGFIAFAYLVGSQGNIVPLQQISACATTISYTISTLSFVFLSFSSLKKHRILSILGLFSCAIFLSTTITNAQKFGLTAYLVFGAALFLGLLFKTIIRRKQSAQTAQVQ